MQTKNLILMLACLLALLMSGCNEFDEPKAIYDPNASLGASPEITAVEPADVAGGGVNVIKLRGTNFSANSAENNVYAGGLRAEIKSATAIEISIFRPPIVGAGLNIQVAVAGRVELARHSPYTFEQVVFEHGAFGGAFATQAFAVDNAENLYAMMSDRSLLKITPSGETSTLTSPNLRNITDMQVGPGGNLYLARTQRFLNRVSADGATVEQFGSTAQNLEFFDFDANGNIYAGGRAGLFIIAPDGNGRDSGRYSNSYFTASIRVFNNAVYSASEYRGTDTSIPRWAIWKNQILNANGDLGENQIAYDWANAGALSASALSTITFSSDGTMFIGSVSAEAPVLMVFPDGSSEVLYRGQMAARADQLVWGPGNSLYLMRGAPAAARRVERLAMGQTGAPYFGRQ